MKPRIYRRHVLNRHSGRATIAEEVTTVSNIYTHLKLCKNDNHVDFCMAALISHMHPTLINVIGCLTSFYDEISATVFDAKM